MVVVEDVFHEVRRFPGDVFVQYTLILYSVRCYSVLVITVIRWQSNDNYVKCLEYWRPRQTLIGETSQENYAPLLALTLIGGPTYLVSKKGFLSFDFLLDSKTLSIILQKEVKYRDARKPFLSSTGRSSVILTWDIAFLWSLFLSFGVDSGDVCVSL